MSQSLDKEQSTAEDLRQQLAAKEELNQSLMSASIKAKQQGMLRQAELEAANTLAQKAAAAAEAQQHVAEQLRAKLAAGSSGGGSGGGLDAGERRTLEFAVATMKQDCISAEGGQAQAQSERDELLNDLQTLRQKDERHLNTIARVNEEKAILAKKLSELKKMSSGGGDQLTKVLKNRLKKAENKLACTIKPVC